MVDPRVGSINCTVVSLWIVKTYVSGLYGGRVGTGDPLTGVSGRGVEYDGCLSFNCYLVCIGTYCCRSHEFWRWVYVMNKNSDGDCRC